MTCDVTTLPAMAADVEEGLKRTTKSLPSKLFYDTAGSTLFEEITRLPEYYLTRIEDEILRARAATIAQLVGEPITLVELGAGSATKSCILLTALVARRADVHYVPVDISQSALADARERVQRQCPQVAFQAERSDFSKGLGFLDGVSGRKLVAYLGSSIGNLDPDEQVGLLGELRKKLASGDRLLLGTDLVKDPAILLRAYDDSQGVTAKFNKNILRHVNRELAADFDPDSFRHVALWNAEKLRIEIYLESARAQHVNMRQIHWVLEFQSGERIHTENCAKFTLPMIRAILSRAGFALEKTWMDKRRWYALHLARC